MTNDEIMQAAAGQLAKDMLDMLSQDVIASPVQFEPAYRLTDWDWRYWALLSLHVYQPPLAMCIITGV